MSAIYVNVEVYAGLSVSTALQAMSQLAMRLGIDVWASINGVRVLMRPGDPPQATYTAWEKALRFGNSHASAEIDHKTKVPG